LKIIKLILLLLSAILLACGLLIKTEMVAVSGAIIFVLALAIGLMQITKDSKLYSQDKFQIEKQEGVENTIHKISKWIEGIVFISIVLGILFFQDNETLKICGGIMWFGSIIVWVLAGTIVSWITNIPLRFGYGGWEIDRKKNRRKK
jgi:hypothetical protein